MIQECVLVSPWCFQFSLLSIVAGRQATATAKSSKASSNVILRLSFLWICKNVRCHTKLNQPAKVKESCEIGYAAGLLHVVGDRHDRVFCLQLVDQLLDLC